MSPSRELSAPLDVRGRIEIATDDGTVLLVGDGDLVTVDAQSVRAVKGLIETFRSRLPAKPSARAGPPRPKPGPADITAQVRDVLTILDLTLELRLAGAPVLRIGVGARPSMLAKMFGAGPVEIVSAAAVTKVINELRG